MAGVGAPAIQTLRSNWTLLRSSGFAEIPRLANHSICAFSSGSSFGFGFVNSLGGLYVMEKAPADGRIFGLGKAVRGVFSFLVSDSRRRARGSHECKSGLEKAWNFDFSRLRALSASILPELRICEEFHARKWRQKSERAAHSKRIEG